MMLRRVDAELAENGYRTHEFGDTVLIERRHRFAAQSLAPFACARDACRPARAKIP
jgi:hypothetical protein